MPTTSNPFLRPLQTSLAAFCAALLAACVLGPFGENPAEVKTRVHAARDIRDTAGTFSDTSLYESMTYGFRIVPGSNDVFEYYHKAADQSAIADDEFAESLFFRVAPGVENLVIDSSGFSAHKVRYMQYCFCPQSYGIVDSGRIVVTPIGSGRYNVTASIRYELRTGSIPDSVLQRGRLKFNRTFRRN